MEADFSGWATKAGLKCSDGRTIMPDAFKHQDKMTVPLVWQHDDTAPANVLGHAVLENRNDGVYTYGFLNGTEPSVQAKALLEHGDIKYLSIRANQLVERSKQVFHGMIREVSLVLAGANPGALIDYVAIRHNDGEIEMADDEAVIYTGLELEHSQMPDESTESGTSEEPESSEEVAEDEPSDEENVEHADGDDKTGQDIYDSMSEEQKGLVQHMIGAVLEQYGVDVEQSATSDQDEDSLNHQEGNEEMTRNVFEQSGETSTEEKHELSHADKEGIIADAHKRGSLKDAVEAYALEHGITNIETLFPAARDIQDRPEWVTRRTEWVAGVIGGVRRSPFSRIRTRSADLTHEEARAKGYVKGTLKKEQFFSILQRETTPQTVYKKQKFDRDDLVDASTFDVVAWVKPEMREMLMEEIARAILIGDGREVDDEDKIKENKIRPIATDDELYVTTVTVNIADANSSWEELVDQILLARKFYKGTGAPAFFTTEETLVRLMLSRDNFGRKLYTSQSELETAMRVSKIVPVEVLEDQGDLLGILVNLSDYSVGMDRGGETTLFDDFDIDYNQYKYLIETRLSGALNKVKSAMVVRSTAGANVAVAPQEPAFVEDTGVVTIPTQTGVVYKNADGGATLTAGAQTALDPGETLDVFATAASGYYFETSEEDEWSFTRPEA